MIGMEAMNDDCQSGLIFNGSNDEQPSIQILPWLTINGHHITQLAAGNDGCLVKSCYLPLSISKVEMDTEERCAPLQLWQLLASSSYNDVAVKRFQVLLLAKHMDGLVISSIRIFSVIFTAIKHSHIWYLIINRLLTSVTQRRTPNCDSNFSQKRASLTHH